MDEVTARDPTEEKVREVPESIMKDLLGRPLSQKIRILNKHKKEKRPREKRKHKPKPRPKNRAALVRKQKKAR